MLDSGSAPNRGKDHPHKQAGFSIREPFPEAEEESVQEVSDIELELNFSRATVFSENHCIRVFPAPQLR
jgi:hypothetical protein